MAHIIDGQLFTGYYVYKQFWSFSLSSVNRASPTARPKAESEIHFLKAVC